MLYPLQESFAQGFIHGHRGCRGLMPENTIPAFIHAVEMGITTLEMDIVITSDSIPLVSHEPWFNHLFTTLPDGMPLDKDAEREHNIFKLSYEQIKKYDVGLRQNPQYPTQKSISAYKPALSEVLDTIEKLIPEKIYYNIELKRKIGFDNDFHPTSDVFADLVMDVIYAFHIENRVIIQSFDHEILSYVKKKYPGITIAILVEDLRSPENHIEMLGFTPQIYSPNFRLINKPLVEKIKSMGMQIIPWTVNSEEVANGLIEYNIDGIITDYPDRIIKIMSKK